MASRPVLTAPVLDRAAKSADLVNLKLREHCGRRDKSMRVQRADIEPIIRDISSLTQPARSRFMPQAGTTVRRRATSSRMNDGHGTIAARTLASGLNSGLSSPSRVWFKLKIADRDLMQSFPVKIWLAQVERIMADFLQGTNFYEATKCGYSELGLFGTEASFMEGHWRSGMVTHALTFGEYWISEGSNRRPDTLLRYVPMTIKQIVEQFVADSFDSTVLDWDRVSIPIKTAWDNSNYDDVVDIMHLCEPNPAWDAQRLDVKGKPWRSIYWEQGGDNGRLLSVEGAFEQPFFAARWETVGGGDPWGQGPGWDALPDLRTLQLNAKRLGDGTDLALRPPLLGPSSVKVKLQAGAYTATNSLDRDSVKPAYSVPYQALQMLDGGMPRLYGKIDDAFFVPLFMAITQMEGVQPRNMDEIASRNQEAINQLGGVIDRVNVEKLGVAIDRTFGICYRLGKFPPAPQELHGVDLEVDYVSILAQMQRAVGLAATERSLGFIGNLAGAFPGIADNIDSDAVARDYWDRSGAGIDALRDPQVRDAMRAQRAKEQAMAQARENAPALADGAKAAELLSRTDVRGGDQSALDALLSGGQ